jgi:hypothetical protein
VGHVAFVPVGPSWRAGEPSWVSTHWGDMSVICGGCQAGACPEYNVSAAGTAGTYPSLDASPHMLRVLVSAGLPVFLGCWLVWWRCRGFWLRHTMRLPSCAVPLG